MFLNWQASDIIIPGVRPASPGQSCSITLSCELLKNACTAWQESLTSLMLPRLYIRVMGAFLYFTKPTVYPAGLAGQARPFMSNGRPGPARLLDIFFPPSFPPVNGGRHSTVRPWTRLDPGISWPSC